MVILITIVHVVVCLFLAIVVLLQSGKAADLAGAFGGMGSQTVFGPRGSATVLSKATTIAAALFMVTSLTLSILSTRAGKSSPALFQKVVPVTQRRRSGQHHSDDGDSQCGWQRRRTPDHSCSGQSNAATTETEEIIEK